MTTAEAEATAAEADPARPETAEDPAPTTVGGKKRKTGSARRNEPDREHHEET